jgi:DNA-binding transcriptional LysR family regulator
MLDIAGENIDIALRMTAFPAPDLVSIPIAKLEWLICASGHYLATAGEPHSPSDLEHHPCMNYWSAQADDAWHLRCGEEDLKIKVRNRYRANNPEVIVDAALAGQGIALLPLYCCRDEIADGRLLPILRAWNPVTKFGNQITAVAAPDRIGFSRNQAFLQFLKERFAPAI